MKQLIWTLGLVFLMVAFPAFGEKAGRRTASVERTRFSPSVTAGTKRKVRDLWVRLGISSGFSETNSNVASQQSARDQGGYHQNAYVGLNANAVFFRYGYLDLDAYYAGSPSAKSVATLDRITGTTDNSVRKLRNYGGLGELGARLPLFAGRVKFVPTVGAGFGLFRVSEDREGLGGENPSSSSSAVSGPYATVGLGITFGGRFTISGDAALSIAASGSLDSRSGDTIISEQESSEASFNRIRAGAYYRLSQPLTLGVQYVRRRLRNTISGETVPFTETTNQVLGTMAVHF